MNSKYITVFFVIFYWLSVPQDMNSCWLTEEQGVITTWPASQSNHFMIKNYSRASSDSAVHCKKGLRYSRPGIGLGTEFHSEKIPRNRLGTVSVIPRHSEFHGRANSEARMEQNGPEFREKFSSTEQSKYWTKLLLTRVVETNYGIACQSQILRF